MPRTARKKSETRIYHIMLRGINRQSIFGDDELRQIIKKQFKVEAWTLQK
ncbi:hypothetical protein [Alkaliphilus metalliredigens]|nr:hypothetical protein [Alkaliphilus metalliredigens]